jgi:hypothetical protein
MGLPPVAQRAAASYRRLPGRTARCVLSRRVAMSRKDEGRAQAGRTDTEDRQEAPPASGGNTVTAQGETQQPKAQMPHERDESAHSQAADNPSARRMGEIAHDDVMEGQQDTSKAQELDATYHRMRQGGTPEPGDKPTRNPRDR